MLKKLLNTLKTENVFLTGGAGVGKSYLAKEVISHYKNNSKHIVVLGSTGISAVNIGGQTLHSFFSFGICSSLEELVANDKKNRKKIKELKELLKSCDLIVIDEISMVSSNLLDMIKYRVQSTIFEGSFLFTGDFFQLPPIVKKFGVNNLFSKDLYAFQSSAWEFFDPVVIELKDMKRTNDKEFFHILKKVRMGQIDTEVIEYLIKLSKNSTVLKKEPTFLYGRNKEAIDTNANKLSQHGGKEVILNAEVSLHNKKASAKKIQSWKNSLPVNEELKLKIGVPVLFTSNKWGKFFNGERGIVKDIAKDSITIEKNGRDVKVEKQDFDLIEYEYSVNEEVKENSLATMSQYPVKLAYAITIHKSQGMSIDKLVCNINNIFTPSQFYVAIGRAVNPNNLYIEYNREDLQNYLKRIINIDNRVKQYYLKFTDLTHYNE